MTKLFRHRFIETIPDAIESDIIYISIKYKTVIHLCACGCGKEVVTPLSSNDWGIIFDGDRISLYPSIGNWSLPCRSHYWIKNNEVKWAPKWSKEEIEFGRKQSRNRRGSKHCKSFFQSFFKD